MKIICPCCKTCNENIEVQASSSRILFKVVKIPDATFTCKPWSKLTTAASAWGVAARGCRPPAAAMYVDVCQRMSMYVNVFQCVCVCVNVFFCQKNEVVVANGSTVTPGGDDILVSIEFSTPPGFSAACQRCVLAFMSHSMS